MKSNTCLIGLQERTEKTRRQTGGTETHERPTSGQSSPAHKDCPAQQRERRKSAPGIPKWTFRTPGTKHRLREKNKQAREKRTGVAGDVSTAPDTG